MTSPIERTIEQAFKAEWAQVVATLIRRTGDWDLAEECTQEAFAQALIRWPTDGVPGRPGAWLMTVASNRALDRLRRARRGNELLEQLGRDPSAGSRSAADPAEVIEDIENDVIKDDRLRLIFTCCHPALPLEGRVALTLRSLGGLTTAEIARAFLVPEATMAKRLTRAKAKIAGAGIPYRVPPPELLPERVVGVLAVLYLLFNEGYAASGGGQLIRGALCTEAIRLTGVLVQLMPDEPEAAGLLALMLLNDSRRAARLDADGDVITLEEQDRRQWDHAQIAHATALLESALRRRAAGPYQLQAAIAACHAQASSADTTEWAQIAKLYGLLREQMPSPIVELNRAVAVAMAGDLDGGLALVDGLAAEGPLVGYYLLEATRADLQRRRGERARAAVAYRRALALDPPAPQRRFLQRRLIEVTT
jgi:RNA polymerase sigma-70 factor (ECF subfamily)